MVLIPADGGLIEVRIVKLTKEGEKTGYFEEYASINERDPFDEAKVAGKHNSPNDKDCIIDEDLMDSDESDKHKSGNDKNLEINRSNDRDGSSRGENAINREKSINKEDSSDETVVDKGSGLQVDQSTPGVNLRRFIVAQEAYYGVEITLRKGFSHGRYYGAFGVIIENMTSGKMLYQECIFIKSISRSNLSLDKHERFTIKTLPAVIVDGEVKENVRLSFQAMNPGMAARFLKSKE
jgi:hypothetical protein